MRDAQTVAPGGADVWVGLEVFDSHGDRIGKLHEIYLAGGGLPHLALVKTGLFGLRSSFAPLAGAPLEGAAGVVPSDKSRGREAPARRRGEQEITPEEGRAVYRHYALRPPPPPAGR